MARPVPIWNTVGTKVPLPNERARYMSTQSAVQHLSSGTGAILSTFLLVENADKSLSGIRGLGIAALVLSVPMPFLIGWVAQRVSVRPAPALEPAFAADGQRRNV